MTEQETLLYIPKGEWYASLLRAFTAAGLALETITGDSRCYELRVARNIIPIVFLQLRSKEIPEAIANPNTIVQGGFTGEDIVAEAGAGCDWTVPLAELDAQRPQPVVYLGSTPNLRQRVEQPGVGDLRGGTIFTSYPNLARRYLLGNGLQAGEFTIAVSPGTIERRWRDVPANLGIVDIADSGRTRKANQIQVMAEIMAPGLVFIGEQLSIQDQSRVDDLQERLYLAARTPSPVPRVSENLG